MNNDLTELNPPSSRRPFRLSMRNQLLAAALALCCAPLSAEEVEDVAKANVVSTPQQDISWMSGGIGDDARNEMRRAATAYNVHVLFSDRQGSYLASVPFAVARRNGQEIYAGVSDGPLLYLKLRPGTYRISAEIDGVWQNRQIQAGASGAPAKLSFVAKGQ